MRVEERTDAGAIPRQHETLELRIPDRDRELAVQMVDESGAVLFVEVNDHLRVGVRAKRVAGRFERGAQLDVVEDFAIEDGPHGAVFVRDGLAALAQVDDAETRMSETAARIAVEALAVGTAVMKRADHRRERGTLGRRSAFAR